MNLSQLSHDYNTQGKCIAYLEKLRWHGKPVCPKCGGERITPRKSRKHYHHCNSCNRDFTVLVGTIFESSKLPLPKWFQLVALMLNARKGISSMQIARHLGVTYKTAWYCAMRIRCAMIDGQVNLLEGIVEVDEAYIGGKPRHRNTKNSTAELSVLSTKRGRGTKKVPIVGFVERGGKKHVRLEVANKPLTSKYLLSLLHKYVNTQKSVMMSDDYKGYHKFEEHLQHLIINHSKKIYADGIIHTNTIEGVWSIIKNGIRGEYHVLSKKYLPFYLAEFAYKYNRRSKEDKAKAFDGTMDRAVSDDKCLVDYKPKGDVGKTVYGENYGKVCSSPGVDPKPRRPRGRPKGSKNKPKPQPAMVPRKKSVRKPLNSTKAKKKANAGKATKNIGVQRRKKLVKRKAA